MSTLVFTLLVVVVYHAIRCLKKRAIEIQGAYPALLASMQFHGLPWHQKNLDDNARKEERATAAARCIET